MNVNVFLALVALVMFAALILPLDGAVMLLLLHALVLFLVLLALGFVGLAVHLGAVLGARVMLGLVHLVRLGSVVLLGFAMSLVGGFDLQHFSSFRLGLSTMVKAFQGLGETGSLALDSACMGGFCQLSRRDFLALGNTEFLMKSTLVLDRSGDPFLGHWPEPR